jgi:hypothetical protein
MNVENIKAVIAAIQAAKPHRFMMALYTVDLTKVDSLANMAGMRLGECGTAGCIAGWCEMVRLGLTQDKDADKKIDEGDVAQNAADFLELASYKQERALFAMQGANAEMRRFDQLPPVVRKSSAVNVLTGLIETGKVDWDGAIKKAADTHDVKLPDSFNQYHCGDTNCTDCK